jgi:CMP-N-acetylneuraminic acid synthetase
MRIITIIPARKNSSRLKNKNIKKFFKKELIYWTIKFAKRLVKIEDIFISTDSQKVIDLASTMNIKNIIRRKKKLCQSNTKSSTVVNDVLKNIKYKAEGVILLQPTTPYRDLKLFKMVIKKFKSTKENFISIGQNNNNKFFCSIKDNKVIFNKKDNIKKYALNGSLYLYNSKHLKKYKTFKITNMVRPVLMKKIYENFDIDTYADWKKSIQYFKKNKLQKKLFS